MAVAIAFALDALRVRAEATIYTHPMGPHVIILRSHEPPYMILSLESPLTPRVPKSQQTLTTRQTFSLARRGHERDPRCLMTRARMGHLNGRARTWPQNHTHRSPHPYPRHSVSTQRLVVVIYPFRGPLRTAFLACPTHDLTISRPSRGHLRTPALHQPHS